MVWIQRTLCLLLVLITTILETSSMDNNSTVLSQQFLSGTSSLKNPPYILQRHSLHSGTNINTHQVNDNAFEVCPELFSQYGEYCYHTVVESSDYEYTDGYCAHLTSTLPYPTADLENWQTNVIEVLKDNDIASGDVWSGATLQSDSEWHWPDMTLVQKAAWEILQPSGDGLVSAIEYGALLKVCKDCLIYMLCQVVPAPTVPLLTIINTTSSSLHVSWTKDSDVISKYIVAWSSLSGENQNATVDYNITDHIIEGLTCDTEYNIFVTAYTDINNFARSLEVKATTVDEGPGKPILKEIVPDESEPTKLQVFWIPAEYNCSAGLSYYLIEWETDYYSWSHNTEDGEATTYTIRHLLPNTTYTVTVAARSHMGILGEADSQIVNTPNIDIERRCKSATPFPNKYPLYKWPKSDCGMVNRGCPNVMLGNATWICECDGEWVDLPDLSDCHNLDLSGWNDIFNSSKEPAGDSLGKLASNISSDSISTGDIPDLVEILDASSTRHSADMQNASLDDQLTLSLGYLNGILNVSDMMLESEEVWHGFPREQLEDQATNIQIIIGDASGGLADVITPDDEFQFTNFSNIGVKVEKHNKLYYENATQFNLTYRHQFFDGTWIRIPSHIGNDPAADSITVSVLSFKNMHCILNTVPQCEVLPHYTDFPVTVISSPMMGVVINGEKWNSPDNQSHILAAFDNTYINNGYNGANIRCVFWNNLIEAWDGEGCKLVSMEHPEQPVCSCDHLTNLAVIMDVTGKISMEYDETLTIITRIGCSISIICLVFSIIVLSKIINEKNTMKTAHVTDIIHLNLCFSLLIALITLIAGLDATANAAACAIVAFVLHYFFMASFCWMGLEAANIGHFLIMKNETILTRIRYQHVLAYGLPGFIVVVTLISTGGVGYGTQQYCWLSTDNGVIWALVAPASLILTFNMIIIVWVLRIITAEAVQRETQTHGVRHNVTKLRVSLTEEERRSAKRNMRRLLMLTVLLGPTWLLGFLSSFFGSIILMGLFTILNSMQGALIFVLLVIVRKKRRDILLNDIFHIDILIEFIMQKTSIPKLLAFRRRNSNYMREFQSDFISSERTLDTSLPSVDISNRTYNDSGEDNKPDHGNKQFGNPSPQGCEEDENTGL